MAEKEKCCKKIMVGYHWHLCERTAGHGPDKKYCWQHDPVAKEKQAKEKQAKEMSRLEERQERRARIAILLSLAEGISTKDLKEFQLIK